MSDISLVISEMSSPSQSIVLARARKGWCIRTT